MRHLESVAAAGQQIVLFSSDERVAELVRSAGGWVGYMHEVKAVRPVAKPVYAVQKPLYDVNRHLSAVANDHEAEKWYEPVVPKTRYVRRAHFTNQYHQLTEASLIEDCPSVDATAAARLRALGIDRVGDLLTTDPHWLAEHLRLSGVTSSTVMRWQAEAKLLCSVPQLRPFDARVLAGAGVRHPRQLAEMHPSQLLDRVERFLATDRGRDILRSGNSYELSRITQWIASAKSGEPRGRNYVSTARTVRTDNYYDDPLQNIVAYRQPRPDYDYDAAYQSDSKLAREPWDDDAYGTTHRAAPRVTDLERFESRQRRTREDVVQKDVDREPVSHREARKPRPVAGESQRASHRPRMVANVPPSLAHDSSWTFPVRWWMLHRSDLELPRNWKPSASTRSKTSSMQARKRSLRSWMSSESTGRQSAIGKIRLVWFAAFQTCEDMMPSCWWRAK